MPQIVYRLLPFSLYALFVLSPNARPFFKYLAPFEPAPLLAYVAASLGVFYLLIFEKPGRYVREFIGNYWFMAVAVSVLLLLVWTVHPIADGLKLQMRGSDQDDCVIIGASRLARFLHPYLERPYTGNPCWGC